MTFIVFHMTKKKVLCSCMQEIGLRVLFYDNIYILKRILKLTFLQFKIENEIKKDEKGLDGSIRESKVHFHV